MSGLSAGDFVFSSLFLSETEEAFPPENHPDSQVCVLFFSEHVVGDAAAPGAQG